MKKFIKKRQNILAIITLLAIAPVILGFDITGAVFKAKITTTLDSGSTALSMNGIIFPADTDALKNAGLISSSGKNTALCKTGSECPSDDEYLSTMYSGFQALPVDTNGYVEYQGGTSYYQCWTLDPSSNYYPNNCGSSSSATLIDSSNFGVGTDFFIMMNTKGGQNPTALEVTITTPLSASSGTFQCDWYAYGNGAGTQSLKNVNDPSNCFTTAGTHVITWDMPDSYMDSKYYSYFGGYGSAFGFEFSSVGSGGLTMPVGGNFKVSKNTVGGYIKNLDTSSPQESNFYIGGGDIQSEMYWAGASCTDHTTGCTDANVAGSYNPYNYGSPMQTSGSSGNDAIIEFTAYFDIDDESSYWGNSANKVVTIGSYIRCDSMGTSFGCYDVRWTSYQQTNCPNGTYQPYEVTNAITTSGWHTIKWESTLYNCFLSVDGVQIWSGSPSWAGYAQRNSINSTHNYGQSPTVKAFKDISFTSDESTCVDPADASYSWATDCYYFNFKDGWDSHWDNGFYIEDFYDRTYSLTNPYRMALGTVNTYSDGWSGNITGVYPYNSILNTSTVGNWETLAGGSSAPSVSATVPPFDAITSFDQANQPKFSGTTTIGTNLPGGTFLQTMATQGNIPITFLWVLIACALTVVTIAVVLKTTGNFTLSLIMGGIILGVFCVPSFGIFPLWVVFVYAIFGSVIVILNARGVSV